MDIILNYLDSMFAGLPDSEEARKAKAEMASMMEDKYMELKAEGKSENEAIGTVISEFGSMDELAAELDLSSKLTASGQAEKESRTEKTARKVSRKEAEKYLADMNVFGQKIGFGVMLCIWSPIMLILGAGTKLGEGMGLIVLLAMVAAAVAIFIPNGMACGKYEYLQNEPLELEAGTTEIFKHMQEEARPVFAKKITLGVGLILIGVMLLIGVALIFGEENERAALFGVAALLVLVAAGVYQFVRYGLPYGCFDVLLQEGGYSISKKKNKLIDKIGGIYWPLVTAAYLAWSFVSDAWGKSWIIWPVAGVLFAAIAGICAFANKEE